MMENDRRGLDGEDYSEEYLDKAKWWIQKWGWGFSIVMVLVWPILSLPAGVFSRGYFAMWVFISIVWSFVATTVIIALPVYESSDSILAVVYFMMGKPVAKNEQGAKGGYVEGVP